MDTAAIRRVLKHVPFRPFVLQMNDRREFAVKHPEWLMVSRNNVVFVDPRKEDVFHLEPLLISSLQMLQPKDSGKAGNPE